MIRRFKKLDDGGFLRGFTCGSDAPDFERINVIYGPNGSGKSSIARMLHRIGAAGPSGLAVSIECDDASSLRTITGPDDPFFDRVLVFGEDYVEENHHLSHAAAAMDAILTVRERAKDEEERLVTLRSDREKLVALHEETDGKKKAAKDERDRVLKATSSAVVDDLSTVGGPYTSRGTYATDKVAKRLVELRPDLCELSEEELADKKKFILSEKKERLGLTLSPVAIDKGTVENAKTLLASNPVTIVLDTLAEHPDSAFWVQQGLSLHADRDTCTFCGGPLSESRRHDIAQHFSGEVEDLQRKLDTLINKIGSTLTSVRNLKIPDRMRLFEPLREVFDSEAKTVQADADALAMWCTELLGHLREKRENTHRTIEFGLGEPPTVDIARLLEICADHDRQVDEHDQLVQSHAKSIELHHLAAAQPQIDAAAEKLAGLESDQKSTMAQLKHVDDEINMLENLDGDPGPSAEVLTREVAVLLGRDELEFVPAGPNKYQVLRHGDPATGLSQGERTAVTLVHFLEMVARFDASNGKPIVVIDDPVSSLDSSIFHGASTKIWTAAISDPEDHVAQLFLLTHNFELFRQWDIQLESLSRSPESGKYPAKLFELRGSYRNTPSGTQRIPELVGWPPSQTARRKMRSSYHHAFLCLAEAHRELSDPSNVEARLDAQMLFPNVIRRVLETFLAFKDPAHAGKFGDAMREAADDLVAGGYAGDADALRNRLVRFAHSYSHAEDPNVGRIIDPDEIEPTLKAVFLFMRHVDEQHFTGLCKALSLDADDLAPNPNTTPDADGRQGSSS